MDVNSKIADVEIEIDTHQKWIKYNEGKLEILLELKHEKDKENANDISDPFAGISFDSLPRRKSTATR